MNLLPKKLHAEMRDIDKRREARCNGHIFRARLSHYFSEAKRGSNANKKYIHFHITLYRMKTWSCPGCKKCGYIDEYMEEIGMDDLPVQDITEVQDKKLYRLEAMFSHDYFDGTEFEGLTLVEVKEEDLHEPYEASSISRK
jgi:hypothetical protein